MRPHVRYYCPFAQQNGYARAAEDYCMALHRAGVDLRIVPLYECDADNLDEQYEELLPLVSTGPAETSPTHVIIHAMPLEALKFTSVLKLYKSSVERILVTTWETSAITGTMAKELDEHFDRVIVPSKGAWMAILAGGYSKEIDILPHCFNKDFWTLERDRRVEGDGYAFYTTDAHTTRKNLRAVLIAYYTAFTADDDVTLSILASRNWEDAQQLVAEVREALNLPGPFPEVYIDGGKRRSMNGLLAFHDENDCYVTASRGEGFGLGACEARIVGNHLITPAYNVCYQDMFREPDDVRFLCHTMTPVVTFPELVWRTVDGQRYPGLRTTKPNGTNGDQLWREVDILDLREAMEEAYESRPVRYTSNDDLLDALCYETIGAQFLKLLDDER